MTTPASTRTTSPSNTARSAAGIGAAHVAVAQRPGERTEGVDDLHDIGIVGGLRLDPGDDRPDDVGQVGEQGHVEHGDEVGEHLHGRGRARAGGVWPQPAPWCRARPAR